METPEEIKPKLAFEKLRDYQQDAIKGCLSYIRNYNATDKRSMLVAMPTGSGKTAIMAVLSRCLTTLDGIILVVSPRTAISKQLKKEIGEVFFKEKIFVIEEFQRPTEYYQSGKLPTIGDRIVLVTTIQKIDFLKRSSIQKYREEYQALLKQVGLVIFDEGHYEPALSWSDTIRSFNCPRIIFTATPFRNDFKDFNIDWNLAVSISYDKIQSKKYLRKVEFSEESKSKNAGDFIERVIGYYRDHFGEPDGKKVKLIINCDNHQSIVTLTNVLKTKNLPFIAIHERFTKKYNEPTPGILSQQCIHSVPGNPEKMAEAIWIHQYKLLEGIDDTSFRMLAIYEPFKSTRALIQQVGRIIRNPKQDEGNAYVFDFSGREFKKEWEKYLLFDHNHNIRENFNQAVFDKYSNALDEQTYIFKKLRDKFTGDLYSAWSSTEMMENLVLPLKVNLLQREENFVLSNVTNNLIEPSFRKEDKIFFRNDIDTKTTLYYYFTISNSEFLSKNYFPSISQDVLFIRDEDNYIAFYDSAGRDFSGYDDFGFGMAISPDQLYRIFRESPETRFFRVNLKNANLGAGDLRNHSYSSPSLARTTPFLNDFTHFVGSAFGSYTDMRPYKRKADLTDSSEQRISTYIGFSKGRLSQDSTNYYQLGEYLKWLEEIKKTLNQHERLASFFFDRYAKQITTLNSQELIPVNILIDLAEIREELEGQEDDEKIDLFEWIEDLCIPINAGNIGGGDTSYSFELRVNNNKLTVNDKVVKINIIYNSKSKKYILEGDWNLKCIFSKEKDEPINLISFFNKKQCFRILTETHNIYANGHFYKPALKFGAQFNASSFPLNGIMFGIPILLDIASEKGKLSLDDGAGWAPNSLFGFIDAQGRDATGNDTEFTHELGNPNLILCTDLNTEIADFVCVSGKKLIFIHVKGKGNKDEVTPSYYSATNISEVCNQAVKNLHYISVFDNSKPKNIATFTQEHTINNARAGININVKKRLRTPHPNANISAHELWEIVEKAKFDGSTEREIWLVLGRIFSKKRFIDELKEASPKPEAVQAAIILQNTMASVSSMGAKLKIFCSP